MPRPHSQSHTLYLNHKLRGNDFHACFVEFKKAFDSINGYLLWRKLSLCRIRGPFLDTLINMYTKILNAQWKSIRNFKKQYKDVGMACQKVGGWRIKAKMNIFAKLRPYTFFTLKPVHIATTSYQCSNSVQNSNTYAQHYNCTDGSRFSSQGCFLTVMWKRCRDGLCQYVDLAIMRHPPCLHTFWHAIPISLFSCFYTFLMLISCSQLDLT